MGNLQIKDIDPALHERLRERAEAEHMSMRDYVLRLLERDLSLPSLDEWLDEVMAWEPATGPVTLDTATIIREGWEERADRILSAAEESTAYDDGR